MVQNYMDAVVPTKALQESHGLVRNAELSTKDIHFIKVNIISIKIPKAFSCS